MNKPVLQVEDEAHDVLFLQFAFEQVGVIHPLLVARDGREAISYLQGLGMFANREQFPLPGLVLLDLRLPQVPGLHVLKWIRQQPAFVKLPVIVLSSSDQDSDVEAAYRLGANAYVVKPLNMADRIQLVRRLKQYWLDMDAPPPDCKDWLSLTLSPPRMGQRSANL
jgi:two-component system response regulator